MLPFERYWIQKIKEKHGERKAEIFRMEHILTDDEDLDVKFFVFVFKKYPEKLTDAEKSMYLYGLRGKPLPDSNLQNQQPNLTGLFT